jgi:Putative addiction module component
LKEMTVAEKIELMEKLWEELSLKRLPSLNGR